MNHPWWQAMANSPLNNPLEYTRRCIYTLFVDINVRNRRFIGLFDNRLKELSNGLESCPKQACAMKKLREAMPFSRTFSSSYGLLNTSTRTRDKSLIFICFEKFPAKFLRQHLIDDNAKVTCSTAAIWNYSRLVINRKQHFSSRKGHFSSCSYITARDDKIWQSIHKFIRFSFVVLHIWHFNLHDRLLAIKWNVRETFKKCFFFEWLQAHTKCWCRLFCSYVQVFAG